MVLFLAIRESFRDHNPVPIRGAVWGVLGRDYDLRVLVEEVYRIWP